MSKREAIVLVSRAIATMLLPLAYNLFVFVLFWRCGPRIADFLLPATEQPQESDQPA